MSTTFNSLIAMVGYCLDEAGVTGGAAGTMDGYTNATAEGKQFVNWGYAEVLRMLPQYADSLYVKTDQTIDWVAGTELYDLPSDFQWLRNIQGGWESGVAAADRYDIWLIDREERDGYYTSLGESTTRQFCYLDITTATKKIGFVPIPTSSKTNNIMIWYWPTGSGLLTATDSTIHAMLDEYTELIALKAAFKILAKAGRQMTQEQYINMQRQERDFKRNIQNVQMQRPEYAKYYADLYED